MLRLLSHMTETLEYRCRRRKNRCGKIRSPYFAFSIFFLTNVFVTPQTSSHLASRASRQRLNVLTTLYRRSVVPVLANDRDLTPISNSDSHSWSTFSLPFLITQELWLVFQKKRNERCRGLQLLVVPRRTAHRRYLAKIRSALPLCRLWITRI